MPSLPGTVDWEQVLVRLMSGGEMGQGPKLRPWEIQGLTLAEVALYLQMDDGKPRPPRGAWNMTETEIAAEIQRVRAMTPTERLELARAGVGG